MKKNFDTSALRKTAADIQGAVVPKSITADMVGGLFSALVEAQGEVIEALGALEREVVTVKVNGYDGEQRVSAAGAKVYVDIFSIGSVPTVALPRQELTANEEGVVTFEVFKGYQYAVFSKLEGYGASFQYTYAAGLDSRSIELWHFPLGVYMCGYAAYYNENDESYRSVPYISSDYKEDLWEDESVLWDVMDAETIDDVAYWGVLVSTENTSFAIAQNSQSEDYLFWSARSDYGDIVPTLPQYPVEPEKFDGNWEDAWMAAVEQVHADYDGNLNTAKILAGSKNPIAAKFAVDINDWCYGQHFLPSAGQLYLMYINRAAIDNLIEAANDAGMSIPQLFDTYYWSSTQADEFCAWGVSVYDGGTYGGDKNRDYYVRAVSAFHFIY